MNTDLKNRLKSFLDRLANDDVAGTKYEADGDCLREAIVQCEENERLRAQLAGHTDQAVEDTLSDLMTKYDVLAKENVALREVLTKIKTAVEDVGLVLVAKFIDQDLSNPSPQVAKIEEFIDTMCEYVDEKQQGCPADELPDIYKAVRNLRGDK